MSGGTQEARPTDQEVADWFRENFGSALYPTESRKQWVKDHWSKEWHSKEMPGNAGRVQGGQDKEQLLQGLCPDLVRYFDTSPQGLYVTAEPKDSDFEVKYDVTEIAALRNRVEKLERLVSRLTLAALEIEFRKSRQNPPQAGG